MTDTEYVPCIESPDETHADWVVCNYLDTADIRFHGTFAECEQFIGSGATTNTKETT